jgi:hypothetical protein
VRRKNPKREDLFELGAVPTAAGDKVWARWLSTPLWISGVGSLVGSRVGGSEGDTRLRLGEGLRDDDLDGRPNRVLLIVDVPILDSVELVRRCDGKLVILL